MEEQILVSIIGTMIHYALTSHGLDLHAASGIKRDVERAKGLFDANQPVQSSAEEVVAAIKELKHRKITGSDKSVYGE